QPAGAGHQHDLQLPVRQLPHRGRAVRVRRRQRPRPQDLDCRHHPGAARQLQGRPGHSQLRLSEVREMTRVQVRAWALLVTFVLAAASGCGSDRCRVPWTVRYEDGSSLQEGTVAGEAKIDGKLVGVQGAIRKDGSFEWGTERPGDGALPGKYRVVVLPR